MASSLMMLKGVNTGMGVVNPRRYPPMPLVFILVAVIITNTSSAQDSSVERSLVAGYSPIRLERLHSAE